MAFVVMFSGANGTVESRTFACESLARGYARNVKAAQVTETASAVPTLTFTSVPYVGETTEEARSEDLAKRYPDARGRKLVRSHANAARYAEEDAKEALERSERREATEEARIRREKIQRVMWK